MLEFQNTYIQNPSHFFSPVKADHLENPELILFNYDLALELTGIDFNKYSPQEIANYFSGQDKTIDSISLAYSGHQFGHLNPTLGDGRAMLMGEILTKENKRFDIQLKGSGPTPYSRNGDGKSALGPVIREYLVSEAMHSLGVPTTRALCAVNTNENVFRQTPEPGGIFTRVASSHIRIGTFEYFAIREDFNGIKTLADYTIARHYPDADGNYLKFIELVAKKWATMIAKWMSLGFIHGVMNTDNMAVSGETIDFGPCAFMDTYSENKVFSSIDRNGRYAYNNQLNIGKWNLYRFASCFIQLVEAKQIEKLLEELDNIFEVSWLSEMAKKFGISSAIESDKDLIKSFLKILEDNKLDFTQSFTKLTHGLDSFGELEGFLDFKIKWEKRIDIEEAQKYMQNVNPYIIPRNHQVQKAIDMAYDGDYSYFIDLNKAFKEPYSSNHETLMITPKENEIVTATFCGT
jgi:uncharacterized protein YdiU (UPF0061 family)